MKIKNLHKYKVKFAVSALAVAVVATPAVTFAVIHTSQAESSYATEQEENSTSTMPESFDDQHFYDCVEAEFQTEYPEETIPATGLTDTQLAKIKKLTCDGTNIAWNDRIQDTYGIEKMTALTELDLSHNRISDIDLSANTQLEKLNLSNNGLVSPILDNNSKIKELDLDHNGLTEIDLSNMPELVDFSINSNQIDTIDTSQNPKLKYFAAGHGIIENVDFSNNPELVRLDLYSGHVENLDLSHNPELLSLNVRFNPNLANLDVSHNPLLVDLEATNTSLTSIDVSNNPYLLNLQVEDILVYVKLVVAQREPNLVFDFSNLLFLRMERNYIPNTANYKYDAESHILTVYDIAAAQNRVHVSANQCGGYSYDIHIEDEPTPTPPTPTPPTPDPEDETLKTPNTGLNLDQIKETMNNNAGTMTAMVGVLVAILVGASVHTVTRLIRRHIGK